MALLRILLVEDDRLAVQQLVPMLGRAAIQAHSCTDAYDALQTVRRESIDVIVTDWRLGPTPLDVDG